ASDGHLNSFPTIRAGFMEPMLLQRTDHLPDGSAWLYELKLDGYRAIGAKSSGGVRLWSRNENDFNARYPTIVAALATLPDETVVDGEIVALDEDGRPSFNALQNYGSSKIPLIYYLFDLPILSGHDLRKETLETRKRFLDEYVFP